MLECQRPVLLWIQPIKQEDPHHTVLFISSKKSSAVEVVKDSAHYGLHRQGFCFLVDVSVSLVPGFSIHPG